MTSELWLPPKDKTPLPEGINKDRVHVSIYGLCTIIDATDEERLALQLAGYRNWNSILSKLTPEMVESFKQWSQGQMKNE